MDLFTLKSQHRALYDEIVEATAASTREDCELTARFAEIVGLDAGYMIASGISAVDNLPHFKAAAVKRGGAVPAALAKEIDRLGLATTASDQNDPEGSAADRLIARDRRRTAANRTEPRDLGDAVADAIFGPAGAEQQKAHIAEQKWMFEMAGCAGTGRPGKAPDFGDLVMSPPRNIVETV